MTENTTTAAPAASQPEASEIWAAAQLAPGEGIEDGVARIAALIAPAAQEAEPATGRWMNAGDVNRLVRQIDVALYGSGAADQAQLCDLAALVTRSAAKAGRPLLAPRPQADAGAAPAVHADDIAVDRFAAAMKDKLAAARAKGRGGWETAECTQERLSTMLREHVEKGDPRDVANSCMFLWARGEAIAAAPQAPAAAVAPAEAAEYPMVPPWLAKLVGEYGSAGGRQPNSESVGAWGRLVRGINQFVREAITADRARWVAAAPQAPAAATESVLIDGVAYSVPAAVAGELLRLHMEALAAPAAAVAPAEDDDEEVWRRLALQFDGHRMRAIGLLKLIDHTLKGGPAFATEKIQGDIARFLSEPPLSGEEVLAERIARAAAPTQEAEDAVVMSYAIDCEITVERVRQASGADRWAVRRDGRVLNKQGEWEWEPMPSSRDEAFLARCRFDSAREAIDAARARQEGGE